jgi:hypothetical protein
VGQHRVDEGLAGGEAAVEGDPANPGGAGDVSEAGIGVAAEAGEAASRMAVGFGLRLAELHPGRVTRLALLAPGGLDVKDAWEFRFCGPLSSARSRFV